MTPHHSRVLLATSARDYKLYRRLARKWGQDHYLANPTIALWREDRVKGVLSTTYNDGLVCLGPLAIDPSLRAPGIIAFRLIQVMEEIYRQAGLDSYYFFIDTTQEKWKRTAEKIGARPISDDGQWTWYIREGL